jgi:hypothetical protein
MLVRAVLIANRADPVLINSDPLLGGPVPN